MSCRKASGRSNLPLWQRRIAARPRQNQCFRPWPSPAMSGAMKIATWNVNGIKARVDAARTWLAAASPDIALLQETKCVDDAFPRLEFEELGYNIAVHGQKGFNGVALLSKLPFDE